MTGQIDQDVPLLSPGREQVQAWTQLMLVTANALRQRRMELGQAAWSQQRAAARTVQQYANDLDPRVRAMAAADEAAFREASANGAEGFEHRTSADPQFGWTVHTTAGPMPENSPSGMRGAWGLWAHGSYAEKSLSVFVVVPDRETALGLQDEVTRGEQRTLKSLRDLGTYGFQRAEHARTEVRENDDQLRERLAYSLEAAWSDDRDLVAGVMTPGRGEDGDDYSSIDRLAGQLRELEDRGYNMVEVLARLNTRELRERYNSHAADLAGHTRALVRQLGTRLNVVDVEPVDPVVAREAAHALIRGLQDAGIDPNRVYQGSRFDQLRAKLTDLRSEGHDLAKLLADLPGDKINTARDPAAYLGVVVEKRPATSSLSEANREPGRAAAEAEAGIHKTGPDLGPAERMMRRYLAPQTADSVVSCRAWPGLAKQLLAWKEEGAPLAEELARVPEERIRNADIPAGYLKTLLRRGVDLRQNAARTAAEAAGQERGARHTARVRDLTGLDEPGRWGPVPEAVRDGVPPPPFEVRELDPTNVVDRTALEMSRGAGTVEDDAYIEQILAAPDPGEIWSKFNRAADAWERAVEAEEQALERAQTPDDPAPEPREDLIGQDAASSERRRADHDRAIAQAEEAGAPTAAALRAEVAHRPPTTEPGAAVGPKPAANPAPPAPSRQIKRTLGRRARLVRPPGRRCG
ncbi:hypothetical protein Ae168Ps1_6138c [Pseudonocardia sp. Ae168_Ps1]|uniref:hypothetical protein n=1 Tax=unclassified Pseudonocardia TaxID=2619320 RepID=UPI00094AE377|nr:MULTISPECIES: hypothetical protein [unclassified Pseudonocardia]OLL70269.1 hypothetical protein Ae150APs1_6072c [Pseudonocardia sp. Ae150A_Ps1]OLL70542.1 hypothetical protein Ae263Ps1_6292c [Pseudonocardia sp. Ae263_Ps1]OLL70673.1 hypothetical protein Ae168Ps1_6138c [Pseudonocardia sp. Ae168_Ps1]OLL89229.1 hypothetical protein Ae356Ps1_6148 [Pseudonocardia sp. Ae356_Ps1]